MHLKRIQATALSFQVYPKMYPSNALAESVSKSVSKRGKHEENEKSKTL